MSNLAVVVLAAGEGTRMKSATPKVLHRIAGLELIGHVLSTATSLSAHKVVAVLRHERERLESYVSAFYPNVAIAEQDEIPGTGRAVEAALAELAHFDGDVVVLSGDVPLLDVESIGSLVEIHRELGNKATLVSTVLDNPHGYGRIVRDRGELIGIVEQKDASDSERDIQEVNAGVYVFDAQALRDTLERVGTNNAQGEKYLTDVVGILIQAGHKVSAHQITDKWLVAGINDRVQLSEVEAELNRRIVTAWQMAGVTIQEPSSTWIDVTVSLGRDVTLLPGTRLHGLTTIGEGSIIGPDTTLTDVEVGEGVRINRTDATSSKIYSGATVGPFAFIRPGTELGADGKIGAFVETKNAQIGKGAKVPHLSYVGDASIGEGSNIGAGTIFANYDGVNKHRTEIGKQARTGSGNVFVAPVKVGDGAYTAAGSTIRRDVEPGALALNPAAQKNLAGWVIQNRPGSKSAIAATDTE
ncbi:MAG: bifunctional UDP-N-acetylglucosamine diphosphorylase/glucosamine-1-phosphate N-acetyltransferase GlmU [Actinobacteria bacterium]|nr:bifunctional UDP-N-acetylglucosamine diphosphorylase/glucosamine-1-phosphate N-acetyltransferase GlmU [Actinomycetota bacterium]